MKLGTEDKKKVYALVGLGVVGGYLFYTNVLSVPGGSPAPRPQPSGVLATRATDPTLLAPSGTGGPQPQPANIRRATPGKSSGSEFRPTLRSKRPEERVDPATIDPTLRLDLLAKVQAVPPDGGARNIFQFGQPPAVQAAAKLPGGPEPVVRPKGIYGPKEPPPPVAKVETPKPPPPPINLKYYGYSSVRGGGRKTAFFLDGEEILVAAEGETVKRRYKVVRIGVNSVLMEDTVGNSQQSLPLQEDLPPSAS